MALKYI